MKERDEHDRSASGAPPDTIPSEPGALARTVPLSTPSNPAALLGKRYAIVVELGRGGEGAVYKAHDTHADEVVALKVLEGMHAGSADLARLRRELALARRISHPGIVRLHDLVEIDGRWALSMQLVEGTSLERRIDSKEGFTADEVVALVSRLAEALAAAHAAGVIHRDLKPANVLLHADGRPVISDFGISRVNAAASDAPLEVTSGGVNTTAEGTLVGTPLYMAPEQLQGGPATPAVDVYALGLIAYEAATGAVPLADLTVPGIAEKRATERAAPLASHRPDLPSWFAEAIDNCLDPDPERRFADGAALLAALEQRKPAPAPTPPMSERRPRALRGPRVAAMIVVAAGLAAGATWIAGRAPQDRAVPTSSAAAPSPSPSSAAGPIRLDARGHRRVTFGDGCEEFPSFFPDGKRLVYDGSIGDKSHIFVLDLESGEATQVTTSTGWDLAAAVSPDGHGFAFLRFDEDRRGTYWFDLGSKQIRFLVEGAVRPAILPDGKSLWAGDRAKPTRVDIATGAVVEELAMPGGRVVLNAVALPGGDVVVAHPKFQTAGAGGVAIATGAPGQRVWRDLLDDRVDESLALIPGTRHIVVTHQAPSTDELLALPLSGGAPTSLAAEKIMSVKGIAFSADGKRVAWSTCKDENTVELLQGPELTPRLNTVDGQAAPMPDGRILIISARDGSLRPWIVDPDGKKPPRVVPLATAPVDAGASRDGRRIVFMTTEGLILADVDGGSTRRALTRDPTDAAPSFWKDDKEVIFSRLEGGEQVILTTSVEGGEPARVGPKGTNVTPIPGTDDFLFLAENGTQNRPMVWSGATKTARPLSQELPEGHYGRMDISPDKKTVVLASRLVEVVFVDFTSGRRIRSVEKGGDPVTRPFFDDRGRVFVARSRWVGDIWVAELGPQG